MDILDLFSLTTAAKCDIFCGNARFKKKAKSCLTCEKMSLKEIFFFTKLI
jgi:hypothetical protein